MIAYRNRVAGLCFVRAVEPRRRPGVAALAATVAVLAVAVLAVAVLAAPAGAVAPAAAVTPAATPASSAPAAVCQVTYAMDVWEGGFTASITIKNTGTTAINGWYLGFTLPAGQVIANGWGASFTPSSGAVTGRDLGYNAGLAVNDSVGGIGFVASYTGRAPARPASFNVNGATCTTV
jgi:hypothetical protein